jgi:glycosyltransferase involved in cell wall biosynthesis
LGIKKEEIDSSISTSQNSHLVSQLYQIIIPVFNEEMILERVLTHAKEFDYIINLVVVNDASTDSTAEILNSWAVNENLKVAHLAENRKKEGAIKEVMELLLKEGELRPYTVLLDADTYLQSCSNDETVNQQLCAAISYLVNNQYTALALRLNAVYFNKPSFFWMCAFTTYIGIQFDNWLLSKQNQLWVINGASGLFDSIVLLNILRNMAFTFETGDLQITVDLMKQKRPIAFYNRIIANSYVPITLVKFFNQRRRWERGTTKVLWWERSFYLEAFRHPSFLAIALIIHLFLYISFIVTFFSGVAAGFLWNWPVETLLISYIVWFIVDMAKGSWVIYREKYTVFWLYMACAIINGPVWLFVIVPARIVGMVEGIFHLTQGVLFGRKQTEIKS